MNETPIPTTVAVAPIDGAAIYAEADKNYGLIAAIVIDSDEMYAVAAEELTETKSRIKALEGQRVSMTSDLNNVVKKINALFKPAIERHEAGERLIKNAMVAYQNKCEAERREAQRIADEAARVERQRLEAEAAALAAEAAEAAKSGDAGAVEQAQAKAAQAEAIREEATFVAPTRVVAAAPAVKGVSTSRPWKCRLPETEQDKIDALQFISSNPQFLHLISFDQAAANSLAKAMKDKLPVPGFKTYQDAIISSRS